eukprot:320515-Chlamydomonas_euryale.AAC.3
MDTLLYTPHATGVPAASQTSTASPHNGAASAPPRAATTRSTAPLYTCGRGRPRREGDGCGWSLRNASACSASSRGGPWAGLGPACSEGGGRMRWVAPGHGLEFAA